MITAFIYFFYEDEEAMPFVFYFWLVSKVVEQNTNAPCFWITAVEAAHVLAVKMSFGLSH